MLMSAPGQTPNLKKRRCFKDQFLLGYMSRFLHATMSFSGPFFGFTPFNRLEAKKT